MRANLSSWSFNCGRENIKEVLNLKHLFIIYNGCSFQSNNCTPLKVVQIILPYSLRYHKFTWHTFKIPSFIITILNPMGYNTLIEMRHLFILGTYQTSLKILVDSS